MDLLAGTRYAHNRPRFAGVVVRPAADMPTSAHARIGVTNRPRFARVTASGNAPPVATSTGLA